MAARAIIGIALGILFAPIIAMLLLTIGYSYTFSSFFWGLFGGDFMGGLNLYLYSGLIAMEAPIIGSGGLIDGLGSGSLLTDFLPNYLPSLFTFGILGMWAGAIERSPGRGAGVAAGIWIGWMIIGIIFFLVVGVAAIIVDWLLACLLTLIVAVLAGVIVGVMTKSEEF